MKRIKWFIKGMPLPALTYFVLAIPFLTYVLMKALVKLDGQTQLGIAVALSVGFGIAKLLSIWANK